MASYLQSLILPQDAQDERAALTSRDNLSGLGMLNQWLEVQDRNDDTSESKHPKSAKERLFSSRTETSRFTAEDDVIEETPFNGYEVSDESEDESLQDIHTNLDLVKEFLVTKPPFVKLKGDLARLRAPSNTFKVKALNCTAVNADEQTYEPRASQSISQVNPSDMSEVMRRGVSKATLLWSKILNLRDKYFNILYRKPVEQGLTKFTWTCRCGRSFTETVYEVVPGAADKCVRTVVNDQSSGDQDTSSAIDNNLSAPSKVDHSSSNKKVGEELVASKSRSPTDMTTNEKDGPVVHDAGNEYLLLCVQQGRHVTKLFHNELSDKRSDQDTFESIGEVYKTNRASWLRLTALSHIEFKRFEMYHSDRVAVGVDDGEAMPSCNKGTCESRCGTGCIGYWFSKYKMIPPIPRQASRHFFEHPEHAGSKKGNRASMPKRKSPLELGPVDHSREGWALYFREEVWWAPIALLQFSSAFGSLLCAISWTEIGKGKVDLNFERSAWMVAMGLLLSTALQQWGERNIGRY
ncbi:MAG: hypothetical protein M1833_007303 [Piccolia ochrophora]|nr:MAG: hypothetical protein M1833_007303 [Piccolia ochrophora]